MLTIAQANDVIFGTIAGIVDDDDEITRDPAQNLLDIGLNSLLMARLLIRLERSFGVNPFGENGASIAEVRSVEQLASHYVKALGDNQSARIGA